MTILQQIQKKEKQIENIKKKIKELQDSCPHVNCDEKHDSNTGNYDLVDMYWSIFHCLDCDKRWHSETKYVIG